MRRAHNSTKTQKSNKKSKSNENIRIASNNNNIIIPRFCIPLIWTSDSTPFDLYSWCIDGTCENI